MDKRYQKSQPKQSEAQKKEKRRVYLENKLTNKIKSIEKLLRSGVKPDDIVDELMESGMLYKKSYLLVKEVKHQIFISKLPKLPKLPHEVYLILRELYYFVAFGVAGFIVTVIVSFMLSLASTAFNIIPGIGEPVALLFKMIEKIAGGVIGIGFGGYALHVGSILGAISGFLGSLFALFLIVSDYLWWL